MNSTFPCLLMATPDLANVDRMLVELAPKLQNIVREFRKGTPLPEMALAFETELKDCVHEGCQALVDAEYNDIEPAAIEDCPVRMQLGGEEYKRRPKSPNTIGTLFGPIVLKRYRYEAIEPGVPGIFPLEMQLGIEAGLATPALAERIGLQCVDHTQQQVLDWLERDHGVKWSAASLRKLSAS